MDVRRLGLIIVLVIAGGAFALATTYGYPASDVRWAFPAVGIAIALLFFRRDFDGERSHAVVGLMAGFALGVGSLAGLAALGRVALYVWAQAHPAGVTVAPFAVLNSLNAWASYAWANAWLALCIWFAAFMVPMSAASYFIRASAIALFTPSRQARGGPWDAKWMTSAQAGHLAGQRVGLPLGRLGGRLLRYTAVPSRGWRGGHHMVIAGTRAGKGVSVVIPAIIDHDGPTVVLDVKGELFAVTRRWRRQQNRRVVVLNPFGVVEPSCDRFNPLDYIRADHLTRDVAIIVDGLVRPETGDGSHFATMARDLLAGTIEVVMTVAEPSRRTLNEVADILLSPDLLATLEAWSQAPNQVGRPAAQIAATLLATGDRERGSILTTVKKALSWASSDTMRGFLSASDFSLDDILDDKADLYIVVPLDQLQAQAVFMRLFVNIVLGSIVRQDGHRHLAKPLLLVLDEFVRLGRMEKLLDIATVAAGAGVEAMFVTQDRGQLEAVYGRADAGTLLGSCATVRVFGLGRTDNATAEWLVGGLGDRTVESRSRQLDVDGKRSGSEQRSKLLTADQVLELPASEMLALFPSQPPLRLKRIISHTDRVYRGKLDPNPTLRR